MPRSTVYNNNITENWDKVGKENKKLVSDFIKYCKSNDKSPQTIFQYEEWLKIFFSWNYSENEDKFFIELKKRDFVYYFGWLRDLGMSANRIAGLKSVLNSLSTEIELLYEDEYPTFRNQLRGLESVHISPVRDKTVLSAEKIDEILQQLVDKKKYQEACYLALLCSSGCRRSEAIQMKPSFFTPETEVFDGDWKMYCTPIIRSKGKGKKGKLIKKYVLKESFEPFFNLWMKQREALGIDSEYLFVTKKKNEYVPANTSTANTFAANISKWFDIDYYNHSSRHFFCTKLKRLNIPDDIIVQIFSWENASMVKIYSDIPQEEVLNTFFKKFNFSKEIQEEEDEIKKNKKIEQKENNEVKGDD